MADTTTRPAAEPPVVPLTTAAKPAQPGRACWRSPTRRAASARPRPPSISAPRSAAIGEHVLIVDLDPQGNASTGLGIERRARRTSTYDVLTGAAPHARRRGADRGAAALHRAIDARSFRPRTRNRPGARPRLPFAHRTCQYSTAASAATISLMCWSIARLRSI